MKLKISWASNRNRRKENQDNLSIGDGQVAFPDGIEESNISGKNLLDVINNEALLFTVTDGMGGCYGGKYAAARCLSVLRESFYAETECEEKTVLCESPHTRAEGVQPLPVLRPVSSLLPLRAASLLEEAAEPAPAPSRLMAAAMEAREVLAETFHYSEGGCTLCAVSVRGNGEVEWVSAGDSSIYLQHRGKLRLINPLDNRYFQHLSMGLPADSREKSVLLNYMGEADTELHTGRLRLEKGDALLIASDGLQLGLVGRLFLHLGSTAKQLVNRCSGNDNATAIVIHV